jgi:protein-tyrosine phosphatase
VNDSLTMSTPPAPGPFRVLVVSAADVSRGPAVRHVLRTQLRVLGNADDVVLASAGTGAASGTPIDGLTARALTELGADPVGHQAHRLSERRLALAGLVLATTRQEGRAAIELRPGVRDRTFTVLEFARLAATVSAPVREPEELVDGLAELRRTVRPVDASEDDLEMPAGSDFSEYERVVRRVEAAAREIARSLAASFPAASARWA